MSWTNFEYKEFACRHCGGNVMEHDTVDELQKIRDQLDFPFIISSGFRCAHHPRELAKLEPGPHQSGLAVDIVCSHREALLILAGAMESEYFTGFGIAQRGDVDTRFIHLDACEATARRPRPHVWSY